MSEHSPKFTKLVEAVGLFYFCTSNPENFKDEMGWNQRDRDTISEIVKFYNSSLIKPFQEHL